MPELEPTTLDELMDRDPTELAARDLDAIIAYHRKRRAEREVGTGKPKKDTGEKVSLTGLIESMKARAGIANPSTIVKRRI